MTNLRKIKKVNVISAFKDEEITKAGAFPFNGCQR
jgi:hypothetical protein